METPRQAGDGHPHMTKSVVRALPGFYFEKGGG